MDYFIEWILPHLYSAVGVVAIIGYAPQIIRLIKLAQCPKEISLSSWVLWFVTYVVSIAYGYFYLHDWRFMVVMAINLVACAMVIGLILYKSKKHK